METIKMERKGYGYEPDNPVKAMNVFESYDYMHSLKAKEGVVVKWIRAGSLYSKITGHMIDEYYIFVLSTKSPVRIQRFSIFIDMYQTTTDRKKPEDFE